MEKWHGSGFYLMGVLADIGRVLGSEGEEYCVKHSISMLIIVVLLLILFKLFI